MFKPHIIILYKSLNRIFFCLIVCSFCSKKLSAQQFNNWIFHYNNGLTFNTSPPSFLPGAQISNPLPNTYLSAASISDNNGQLLFYSDGVRVWNRNNVFMPNGTGLLGGGGTINTALIVPFINDTAKYYLFTAQGLTSYPQPDTNKYSYSVIDMQLNGGLGDVVNKNTLIKFFATEKMVAAPHANGNDIWWIGRDWTNNFYSYKITCQGFQNSNPIISTVGTNVNNNANTLSSGDMKVSPDGKYIAVAYGPYFEIYRFNNSTGVLSNAIKIPTVFCYGVEFSPNSSFLYISQLFNSPVFTSDIAQYNLANYDSTQISNSLIRVCNTFIQGGLQLGPDNKIYQCGFNDPNIGVINNPNNIGLASNFQAGAILLPNPAFRRFPYSYVNLISSQNVQISYIVAPDCRTVTFIGKTYIKGNNLTFKWKWGEPPPVAGTPLDSATQVVPSQGDTTYTTIVHTYPPGQDTFFLSLTVTSDTLCGTGRAGIKVVVKPPRPTANFGYAAPCNSLTVAFTDSSLLNTNPSITHQYAWKPALAPPTAYTNYSALPNNSFTFAAYDSFDVRLIVTSALSCVPKDTIVKRIVLKAKPVAACSAVNNCGSLQASFTSAATIAAGSITQQEYYVGNTLIGTGASFVYSFAAYGSYVVKQVVKSNFGCISDTFLLPVIIKDKPQVNLITPRDSVCNSSSYTITANATVNASTITSYVWLKNNVLLPNNTNTITETNPTGIYTYKLVATSAQGCPSDTAVKTITVVSKPAATINAVNNCGSKQINITSTTTVINDNITSHFISYGDGNTAFADPNNTTYTYANYGTYTVKYVAKSSIGCESDTAYQTIAVKDKPVVNLITPRDSVCNNNPYTITANATVNATTISSYVWLKNNVVLPNNTNSITETNPTGTYTYKLVATSAQGCPSDTAVKTITVVSKPTAAISAVNNCGSKQINITSTAAVINDNITNYFISYGDGNTSAINPNNTTYTYANYGTYTIKYLVKSSIGCASDTVYQTIAVKDKPVVNISYGNNACQNTNYILTGNASVAASSISNYTWLKNGVVLPGNSSTLTENNLSGSYTYKLVATAAQGCSSDTAVQMVVVENYPTASFTAGSTCVGKTITIANNSVANNPTATYLWSTSEGQTSTDVVPANFVFNISGSKTILLKVSSPNGSCVDNTSQTITIDAYPIAAFDITEACLGKPIVISNNSTGTIASYAWQTSNAQQSNSMVPTFIFDTAGNYSIKLDVATANNCSATLNKSTPIQPVQLVTRPGIDTNVNVNQPVQLSITGAATYAWQPFTNLNNAGSSNPVFTSAVTGIYPITVQGTTAQGCKATTSLTIKVFAAGNYLFIPNAFTPNADGRNDKFNFTCSGLKALTFFRVYNRYGQIVYQQNTCSNNGWDGTFGGAAQPMGTYVYNWQGVAFNGQTVSGKGTVVLVR